MHGVDLRRDKLGRMSERSFDKLATKVDRYLRKEDTLLAKAIKGVCSLQREEYRNSPQKRGFEFVITTPVAVLTIPVVEILGAAAKMEDGGSMFFLQERVGKDGELVEIKKIRTMREGSDNVEDPIAIAPKNDPETDPRNTKLGEKIRAYEIDEFPQFLQILKGEISLVDIRSAPQYVIDYIKKNRPDTFDEWYKAYQEGTPGLLSLRSALSNDRKNDLKRHHYDVLYARKASLGLDLFIIYRTGLRMLRKVEQKLKEKR